jgi:hypothetical protein
MENERSMQFTEADEGLHIDNFSLSAAHSATMQEKNLAFHKFENEFAKYLFSVF